MVKRANGIIACHGKMLDNRWFCANRGLTADCLAESEIIGLAIMITLMVLVVTLMEVVVMTGMLALIVGIRMPRFACSTQIAKRHQEASVTILMTESETSLTQRGGHNAGGVDTVT